MIIKIVFFYTILSVTSYTQAMKSAQTQNQYVCEWDICDNSFYNPNDYFNHINKDHIAKCQDNICRWRGTCSKKEKLFQQKGHLKSHMRKHTGEKPFRCTLPNCTYTTAHCSSIYKHYNHQHPNETLFRCTHHGCTAYVTLQKIDLEKHIQTHYKFKCPRSDCTYATTTALNLKKHIQTHKKFKCSHPDCTYITLQKIDLENHIQTHYKFKCSRSDCTYATATEADLKNHAQIHKRFRCIHINCDYVTNHKNSLNDHMNTHKKFKCSRAHCNYATNHENRLKEHKQTHAYFKCMPCNKEFSKNYDLKRHQQTKIHHKKIKSLNRIATITVAQSVHKQNLSSLPSFPFKDRLQNNFDEPILESQFSNNNLLDNFELNLPPTYNHNESISELYHSNDILSDNYVSMDSVLYSDELMPNELYNDEHTNYPQSTQLGNNEIPLDVFNDDDNTDLLLNSSLDHLFNVDFSSHEKHSRHIIEKQELNNLEQEFYQPKRRKLNE